MVVASLKTPRQASPMGPSQASPMRPSQASPMGLDATKDPPTLFPAEQGVGHVLT